MNDQLGKNHKIYFKPLQEPLGSVNKLCIIILDNLCYQFRVPRNLRIDIKDRLEEYSQSIPQLKRGQQTLGALVAVVRPFRYIYGWLLIGVYFNAK